MKNDEVKNEENNQDFPARNTSSIADAGGDDVTYVESTEDGEALPTKDVVGKLRADLKRARADKEEYLTGWQRAKADYINLQKEMEQVRASTSMVTKEKMMESLLPAIDSFDMAMGNKEAWEKVDPNWRTGVEYIYQQIMNGLADSGVEKIDKLGIKFNPSLHESIESVSTDDESKDHTVAKIIQAGYKIGDRVVRPARVNIFEYKNSQQ